MKKVPVIQVVKTEVMRGLFNDPEWSKRYNQAKTFAERVEVVNAYAKAHGKKTKDVILR